MQECPVEVLCHSYLCTDQLISLRSLAAKIAQRYISAVRYTNVNAIARAYIKIQNIKKNIIYFKKVFESTGRYWLTAANLVYALPFLDFEGRGRDLWNTDP